MPVAIESPAPPPLPGLLRADLEVRAHQIRHGLVLKPIVSDHHQMFYMLANVHHQITTGDVLSPPNRFWYYLPNLPFEIQNVAVSFQLELEYLISREAP